VGGGMADVLDGMGGGGARTIVTSGDGGGRATSHQCASKDDTMRISDADAYAHVVSLVHSARFASQPLSSHAFALLCVMHAWTAAMMVNGSWWPWY